jgi:hypothetical protein
MIAYKLIRKLKDGSLSPLFINKKSRIPIGVWLKAEEHPTKGFAVRKGWHCTLKPIAPHLSLKNRIWVEVELKDTEIYNRPESQGGTWVLAQEMMIIRELPINHEAMDTNRKKLIQLRSKLEIYKKFNEKLDQVLHAGLEIEDLSEEVYSELSCLECELDDLKFAMELPDEEWDEDETI